MESLGLILCSLGVALATYPPFAPSISMGGGIGGMSSRFMSGVQPGFSSMMTRNFRPDFSTQGFMGIQQPSFNSMGGRFMSGGPSIIAAVEPSYTTAIAGAPRTTTTTRITVFPSVIGTGTSTFAGGNSAYNGMPDSFSSPYMAGGMSGIAGGSPYMSGGMSGIIGASPYMAGGMAGITGGSPYMSGGMSGIMGASPYMAGGMAGITGGSPYMSGGMSGIMGASPYMAGGMAGITGGSPYMSGGMSGIMGASPYMAGGMAASQGFPMYNNMNGIGGQSSMAYRPLGQSGGSSFYPYSTGLHGLGRGDGVGFSPMMRTYMPN